MTHYGLNDCTNLSNIIDIMNSLTGEERKRVRKIMIDKREGARESERDVRKVRKKHR